MKVSLEFSGYYQVQVFRDDATAPYYTSEWFPNIITDVGLDLLGTGFSPIHCYVGTNGAGESAGDTFITNPVRAESGYHVEAETQYESAPYYGWQHYHFTWGIGAVQGTIAEVGVGTERPEAPGVPVLFSRSRIKLLDGSPTSITLGGVDRLELTYELRQCINSADVAFTIDVDGVATSGTLRPAEIANPRGWAPHLGQAVGTSWASFYNNGALGAITSSPSGTGNGYSDAALITPYVPGSHKRQLYSVCSWDRGDLLSISAIRVGGDWYIGGYSSASGGCWQFSLSPPVAKTAYEDFRIEYEFTWSRCT